MVRPDQKTPLSHESKCKTTVHSGSSVAAGVEPVPNGIREGVELWIRLPTKAGSQMTLRLARQRAEHAS